VSGRRVRIAPSPTGPFHVGSARTALFNWLLARQDPDGVFILRIEDTDESRNEDQWVTGIVEMMSWLGLTADVGPTRQSAFAADHEAAVASLAAAGFLYRCDCTTEMVAARKPPGAPPGYDGYCRDRHVPAGPHAAWRFRTPDEGVTIVRDEIRGEVEFAHAVLEDFVVARSNGTALFGVANVVDDRRDLITDVVRGEEHLPNTPKQMLLWRALDTATGDALPVPRYAHLPILVDEQRRKLSKRRDPIAVERYRTEGFIPDALVNFLALLGWSPRGDDEVVTRAQCLAQFQLADVSHSPAFFDEKKLTHINGLYLRAMSTDEFVAACRPFVDPDPTAWHPPSGPPWLAHRFDAAAFAAIAPVVQERVARLDEVPAMVDFLFLDEPATDDAAFVKAFTDPVSRAVVRRAIEVLEFVTWRVPELHAAVERTGADVEWNLRKAQAPVRVATTGRSVGPPLFESLELLGRDRTLARLATALARAGG
jgi:glutamyl-tRNA synthetase